METLQAIAVVVAVVAGIAGLVLGILNYIHQRDTTRPRVVVRPRIRHIADRGAKETEKDVGIMIVCNVGLIPVIGSTVGFLGKRKGDPGFVFVTPESLNGVEWTGELKPGHVAVLRVKCNGLDPANLGRAYATTIVGDVFTATRSDMRKFISELRTAREKQ